MITEMARVVATEADCLWVETIQQSTCDACSAQKGCGQSLVVKWGGQASFLRVLLEGRQQDQFNMGEQVTIGVPEDVISKGAMFVYLFPLVTMLSMTLFATAMNFAEFMVVVSALLGFALGGLGVRWHSYIRRNDARVQPVLVDAETSLKWH